ncbi:hypothetical protein [Ekhidna sp.]|uniref:hypothetical protein n=1 Tax=Ekhidna sp. TaxID=2608089 RepID=UPI003BAD7530
MKKYKPSYFLVIAVILFAGVVSCNGDVQECYDDWKACQGECPEVNYEQYHRCVAGCGNILSPGYQDCFNNCRTNYISSIRTRDSCLSACDDQVRSCLGVEE